MCTLIGQKLKFYQSIKHKKMPVLFYHNVIHGSGFTVYLLIMINFSYNTFSNWLRQRALSENRVRVDDSKLAFKFLLRNFDKFDFIETVLNKFCFRLYWWFASKIEIVTIQ